MQASYALDLPDEFVWYVQHLAECQDGQADFVLGHFDRQQDLAVVYKHPHPFRVSGRLHRAYLYVSIRNRC